MKAGAPVDATIDQLLEYMEPGDAIIDGGNEWWVAAAWAPVCSRVICCVYPSGMGQHYAALRTLISITQQYTVLLSTAPTLAGVHNALLHYCVVCIA